MATLISYSTGAYQMHEFRTDSLSLINSLFTIYFDIKPLIREDIPFSWRQQLSIRSFLRRCFRLFAQIIYNYIFWIFLISKCYFVISSISMINFNDQFKGSLKVQSSINSSFSFSIFSKVNIILVCHISCLIFIFYYFFI